MLTRLSHKVTLAEDGFQALSIVREAWKEKDEGRFDAIVRVHCPSKACMNY